MISPLLLFIQPRLNERPYHHLSTAGLRTGLDSARTQDAAGLHSQLDAELSGQNGLTTLKCNVLITRRRGESTTERSNAMCKNLAAIGHSPEKHMTAQIGYGDFTSR
jgi:hypothetical protein